MFQIPLGFGGIKRENYSLVILFYHKTFALSTKLQKLIKEVRYENLQSCCDRR